MVKIVAQKLLKKGDSEDLKTITKYLFHGIRMRHYTSIPVQVRKKRKLQRKLAEFGCGTNLI